MSSTSCIGYYNGKFLTETDITISPNDRGFLYGDGVFDTLRAVQRRIVSFRCHYERLEHGCGRVGIKLPFTQSELRQILAELLIKNELTEATIRVNISRGIGDQFGFGYSKDLRPTALIAIRPTKLIPDHLYENGVKIDFDYSPLFNLKERADKIKSLSAQPYVIAKQKALENKCYEMILIDALDNLYEGSSSNLFIVKNGTVFTPPVEAGLLPGTTRARVIQLLKEKMHVTVSETLFSKSNLLQADEVFLTNTNIQVLPVTHAGKSMIGAGKAGSLTRQIINTFRQTLIEILE
jgi:branched-chain amino acid aminotransferase